MKALSVRQPWAWLIVNGYKPLENRTRDTKLRGEVLIHAGRQFDLSGYYWVREHFPHIPLPQPDEFPLGGIVGVVEIIGTREGVGGLTETYAKWYMPPPANKRGFCWILASASKLPCTPCKGKLGFFIPDIDVDELLRQRDREAA